MKKLSYLMVLVKACCFLLCVAVPMLLLGCGEVSNSSSSGMISINVTDAKPILPSGTDQVLITFDDVSVHRTGGGWVLLPLAQDPYTIDLLQFQSGTTTELVPPVSLIPGKYTQIRIGVTDASIRIDGVDYYAVEIPSQNLKTDKEFDFEVVGGGAVDLTVDFDLSQSIVVTDPDTYMLKPVLHVNQTQEAATLRGEISDATFEGATEATIIVTWDKDQAEDLSSEDEEYTRVTLTKGPVDPTGFSIYWLVPEEGYNVLIEVDGTLTYEEFVPSVDLPAGALFELNEGDPI